MFWKRDHRVIHVLYLDADTGDAISQSMVPIEKLPDSFEADTTVHMGGRGDFNVVSADPVTAAQFRRTGKLRLTLRRVKIVHLDPAAAADVLFSLPTISDELPALAPGSTKLQKRVLEMHEDDWRQVELVSTAHLPEIELHFAAIRDIYTKHRDGVGFRKIHIRGGPARPLDPRAPTFADLSAITAQPPLDGIAYRGVAGIVADSFALPLDGAFTLYGMRDQAGGLTVLGVQDLPTESAPQSIDALAALARQHDLCLIDWCRARRLQGGQIAGYFSERAG